MTDYVSRQGTKAESMRLLHRAGVSNADIAALSAELPDVVEYDKYEAVYAKYGVTLNGLREALGDNP